MDILGAYEKTLLKENKIYDKITSILHLKGRNDMLNHNHFQKWGNDKFELVFDSYQGTIYSITLADDPYKMNFVGEIGNWGKTSSKISN